MNKLSELIDMSQSHHVTVKGSSGKTLFELSLFWALLISLAAPHAFFLAALLYLLDVIGMEYDGRPLVLPVDPSEKEPQESTDAA